MPRPSTLIALLSLGLGLATSGCLPPGKSKETTTMKNDKGETMHCRQEYPTGSNIGRTVCRTEEQSDEDRAEARKMVSTPPPAPPKPPQP